MMHRVRLGTWTLVLPVLAAICLSNYAAGEPLFIGFHAAAKAGAPARTQGYLGVDIRDVSDEEVALLKLKDARGAEIIHVDHDGPAGKMGLQKQDVILQMNGQQIQSQDQLRQILRDSPAGLSVTLVISRDGQQKKMTTQLANREEVERRAWEQHLVVPDPGPDNSPALHAGNSFLHSNPSPNIGARAHRDFLGATTVLSPSFTGAQLEVMGPQLAEFFGVEGNAGLLVRSVEAHSPAEEAGIRAGDIVLRINQVAVTSGSDWTKVVRQNRGKPVEVVVLRNRHEQTMTMTPDGRKRSSISPQMWGPESFRTDGLEQAETMMAELSSMVTSMEIEIQQRFESFRKPIQMVKITEEMFTPGLETQRRIKMLQKTSAMVSKAAWRQFDLAEVRDRLAGMADRWIGHESICTA